MARTTRRALMVLCLLVITGMTDRAQGRELAAGALGGFAGDEFPVQPGMRTVCLASRTDRARAKACFDVYPDRTERDPQKDYFYWRFLGRGRAERGHDLARIKLKVRSQAGETVRWDPGGDLKGQRADFITVLLDDDRRFQGSTAVADPVGQRYRPLPGIIRPSIDATIFHVSWVPPKGEKLRCCESTEVGGGAVWGVPEGSVQAGGMPAQLGLEVDAR